MTHLRSSLRLSPAFLLVLGTTLAALAMSGIPQAASAADETLLAEQAPASAEPMSATEREAMRREAIRQRMRSNTRSYATLIEDATVPSEPALQADRSAGHKARVLCRVKDRYTDPHVLPITKQRLVERVAENLSLSPAAVTKMLEGALNCEEVLDGLYPYLFYAGDAQTPAPAPSPIPSPVSLPSDADAPQEVVPAPAATPPPPGAATSDTTPSPAQANVPGVPVEEEDSIFEGDSALTQEAMLRTLCRLRERGLRDARAFERSIPDLSARFADRWNADQDSIAAALRNSALCSNPESITLTAQPTAPAEEPAADVFGPPAPGSAAQEPGAGMDMMQKIKALPPIILAVGGLTVLTFIALIILIILPLFKAQE